MLKAIVDNLDNIPEALRDYYQERDGKFLLTVEGMKTDADVARVQSALAKERETSKSYKAKLDAYASLGDYDTVQAQIDRIAELEAAAAGKIDEAKLSEIVEGRIKTRLNPVEREKADLLKRLAALDDEVKVYKTKETQRTVHDAVRKAATGAKVRPEAIEDALLWAERTFQISEDGKVVSQDGYGPEVWFQDMATKRPHWFEGSTGGGARGSSGNGGFSSNPWSKDSWNMTEQGKIMLSNPTLAEQMKRAAGSK